MNFSHEYGRGGIVDCSGKKASAYIAESSFRLTNLTNLHKYVKKKKVIVEIEEPKDTNMKEATPKKRTKINLQHLYR